MYKKVKLDKFKNKFADVKYDDKSERQVMDVIVPEEGEGPFPAVLYIHGGSWISGDKRKYTRTFTFKLPSQGYVLATMNYRLAPDWHWPAQIEDVKNALRHIRENSEKYNIDLDRIYIWGDSSGGHLAQFAAATMDEEKYRFGDDGFTDIKALISFYGVSDLTSFDRHAEKYGIKLEESTLGSVKSPLCMLMGGIISEDEKLYKAAEEASPINHIKEGFIPTLLQHGNRDTLVAVDQSIELTEKINEVSSDTEVILEIFEGADHAVEVFKNDKNLSRCLDFLDRFAYGGKNPYRKELSEIEVE